ncbi:FtsX-like permease family protein [Inconstantimicrobium porci]|uniref:FtsX-like permease family protein n=1 Tax=Inconstantimicrobium porci TaxID=2652291 RepID=UPI00240A1444|nr:FtsX-like permease family protein [Inconstantimicrobium porci]MDD6771264.1 ABC transporter permease [Inconstantimicrobium porci]
MKKKALRKDFLMEIKNSLPRFLSIFFIVVLGVAFYSGIKSAKNDMMISADKYYDESRLMDIKVMSTLGLSDKDIEALSKVKGVYKAEGSYSADLMSETKDNKKPVIKVMSLHNDINKVTLVKGKMPSNDNECLVDNSMAKHFDYKIGDKISLMSGNDTDISNTLKNSEFVISGFVDSSMYLSAERGKSTIGTGKINGFMFINKQCFSLKAYTEAYILSNGALNETSYFDSYNDNVNETIDDIKKIATVRENERLSEVKEEAEAKIKDAKEELSNSKIEAYIKFADAKKQIADAQAKINSGKDEIAANELQITLAKNELTANKKKIEDSKKQIADGKIEIKNAEISLSENEKKVDEGLEQVALGIKSIESAEIPEGLKKQQIETLKKQQSSLQENKAVLDASRKQLQSKMNELLKGEEEIKSSEAKIKNVEAELAAGEQKLAAGKRKIADGEKTLNDSISKYEAEKKNADEKFAEAEEKIADSEEEINDIKKPTWYVQDRSTLIAYSEYGDNAEKIGAIGRVFPLIFFLVAALVSLTTMTRMVEEGRMQIGTLKALGYNKADIASKFVLYAFIASTCGSILGFLIGEQVFPRIIIVSYKMMYPTLPYIETPINWYYAFTASLLAVACTTVVTIIACYKELMSQPSYLMRPAAPKAGKRILIERIPFIWNRLNFTKKSTLRNLMRYKKRFFMTTFGIAGCMALLLVGYGIKDSISDIVHIQYKDIHVYDGSITVNTESSDKEMSKLYNTINNSNDVDKYLNADMTPVDVTASGSKKDVYLFVPKNLSDLDSFIKFHDRTSKDIYKLDDDGVILTEKLAKLVGAKKGDTITIKNDDKEVKVKVSAVTENYINHYVYMSPSLYEKEFSKAPSYNQILIKSTDNTKKTTDRFTEEVLKSKAVRAVMFNNAISKNFDEMMGRMNIVIYVLIVSAGLLAFIVLYNLNNINVTERQRELATIKVLGFYDNEVAEYVYRENIILTLMGSIFGVFLGILLHKYIITTVETEMIMFGRKIKFMSIVYSLILTYIFSAIVNFVMYFKLKKIDMIESLKSIE